VIHEDITLGPVRLILGDCLKIAPTLEGVDAVITDPPYGIGYVHSGGGNGGGRNQRNLEPIVGDDVAFNPSPWLGYPSVVLFGADHFAHRLPRGRWLIWDKLAGMESFDSFSDVEVAWQNRTGAARLFRYLWKGICQQGDKDGGRVHPSQKPTPLMAWCIEQSGVLVGSLILDPFMGSGTTLIAAIRTGRRAIGIEIDERHFRTAVERVKRELAQPTLAFESKPQPKQEALL